LISSRSHIFLFNFLDSFFFSLHPGRTLLQPLECLYIKLWIA